MSATAGFKRASSRSGTDRERKVRALLESEGWVVFRNAGSKGVCDLIALRGCVGKFTGKPVYCCARLIEVKATSRGPYQTFSRRERRAILDAAQRAGAEAWLYWWPIGGELRRIPASEWPAT